MPLPSLLAEENSNQIQDLRNDLKHEIQIRFSILVNHI
ncbi:hypothetical protein LEP1GSC104_3935 [Leptospira interrogans str. UI 12621]|uniref:Uncharacterized protein n=1 Tax=Leptospira interrogans str. UI 12621 TaxID=1049937 RepID=A0A0F6HCS3_LEPIR|nr:hypothetical protein LEP1GSC104_3935 [Leptospira interrogans str. UI 12621]EMN72201.1 hypothetical protein LEP1GSC100_1989 [Leptospira interrogans serovar Bataviae str. UI 08561]